MSKMTPKSLKSCPSFPHGCGIFQQETAWSWHFPGSFNCDTLAFWGWGEKTIFPATTLYTPSPSCSQVSNLTGRSAMVLPLIGEPCGCSSIQSIANSLCLEDGNIQVPKRSWSPSAHRAPRTSQAALPQVLPALQPSQDGAVLPFQGDKIFYCLTYNQTKKIDSGFCSLTRWQQYNPQDLCQALRSFI